MDILWTIIIGFVAGVIAKFVMPGDNEPSGFFLATILGIVGAFVATYLGQALSPRRGCRTDRRSGRRDYCLAYLRDVRGTAPRGLTETLDAPAVRNQKGARIDRAPCAYFFLVRSEAAEPVVEF